VAILAVLWLAGGLPGLPTGSARAQTLPLEREVEASTDQLAALRSQITAVRDSLTSLDARRRDADAQLGQVVREIGLLKELLAGLDQRERVLTAQRDSLARDLGAQRETYELRKRALAERLRAIYLQGPQSDLEQILTSESFSSLVARLKFSAVLARLDGNLVQDTRDQARRIEAEQALQQQALAGIWEAREEARRESERLELLEAERRGLSRELQSEADRTQSELQRLQRQAEQLASLVERLERERVRDIAPEATDPARGVPFVERAGDLPWPITGSVVREFGRNVHPKFRTVTMHNGLSIAATPGSPVYAVAPGTVAFADHLPGFGRCVIVDHDGGHYTLYANLARIFVARETEVNGGQILAELGAGEGNDPPELYFEIREGRDARDPRSWLRPLR
jgi:septal ring factor EnvC (AmiA/AmiB activator)